MPRKPSEQGPNPMSPRAPRRSGTFGGKRVNTPRTGGSWGKSTSGGGKSSSSGCAVLILGALAVVGAAGTELARWLS